MSTQNSKCFYQNGLLNFPQPFSITNSLMMSFLFQSDLKSLQTVCDKWLNIPTGNELNYIPISSMILVTFSNNGQSGPTTEPYVDWGTVAYQEVILSMFVARVNKEGEVWIIENVSTLVPYIFVTEGIVMGSGREVYGMPKTLGWVEMPYTTTDNMNTFSLKTIGTPLFKKGQQFSKDVIFSINETSEISPPLSTDWKDLEEASAALKKIIFGEGHIDLPGINLIIEIAELFMKKELPFTSLRQLRSISSADEAAYKEVVDFSAKATSFNGGGVLKGTYFLTLPEQALFPIAEDLGLKDGQPALAGFWINWDFIFENGTEIWSFTNKKTLIERIESVI